MGCDSVQWVKGCGSVQNPGKDRHSSTCVCDVRASGDSLGAGGKLGWSHNGEKEALSQTRRNVRSDTRGCLLISTCAVACVCPTSIYHSIHRHTLIQNKQQNKTKQQNQPSEYEGRICIESIRYSKSQKLLILHKYSLLEIL